MQKKLLSRLSAILRHIVNNHVGSTGSAISELGSRPKLVAFSLRLVCACCKEINLTLKASPFVRSGGLGGLNLLHRSFHQLQSSRMSIDNAGNGGQLSEER
jgi:hypothetical protein